MLRSIALIAILSLTLAAQANEAVEPSLRSKALASAGSVTKHADAPFTAGRDPLPAPATARPATLPATDRFAPG